MSSVPPSASQPRPIAPHLQVYRPQLTSVLSILHRLTGIGLSLGAILLVIWLGSIAEGLEAYQTVLSCFSSLPFIIVFHGLAFCFYFHLANGIRHLFWDMGWGYELREVYRSGWFVVGFALGLTLLTFLWTLNAL